MLIINSSLFETILMVYTFALDTLYFTTIVNRSNQYALLSPQIAFDEVEKYVRKKTFPLILINQTRMASTGLLFSIFK